MKINFEPPEIIGALCDDEKQIPKDISRKLKKLEPRIAFLPFVVEKRHLKNTLACMKLMDIRSLLICGAHRQAIARHLASVNAAAKSSGNVDVVVRRRKKFVGMDAKTEAATMGQFCQTCVELLTSGLKKHN